jgi:multidrug resistance efflux pump
MMQEGAEVAVGDVVVRLDPGDLTAQEEQARADLEKQRLSAARRVDELKLQVLDAERAVAEAASALRLAELDASIPQGTIPKLDYDRYQLASDTARQARVRTEAELLNTREQLDDVVAETTLEVGRAEAWHRRIEDALAATQIRAEKPGFMIYGENPFNGKKIFPGETLFTGIEIASIASREDLQIRFWVHEADILDVRPGQRLTVFADAQDSPPFTATLEWMSNQAVNKDDWSDSGYFSAIARPAAGVPDSIWPGMSVMGQVAPPEEGE